MELADGKSLKLTPELVEVPAPGPETDRPTLPFGAPGMEPGPAGMVPTFLPLEASLSAAAFWIACILGDAFEREEEGAPPSGAI